MKEAVVGETASSRKLARPRRACARSSPHAGALLAATAKRARSMSPADGEKSRESPPLRFPRQTPPTQSGSLPTSLEPEFKNGPRETELPLSGASLAYRFVGAVRARTKGNAAHPHPKMTSAPASAALRADDAGGMSRRAQVRERAARASAQRRNQACAQSAI